MKALTLALVVVLAACAQGPAAQSKGDLELAGRLFERTGLAAQIEPLAAHFQEGVQQNRGKLPDELLESLAEAGRQSYALPALRDEIVPLLAEKLSAADTREVLAWLDRPLGRRITRAEEAAATMTDEAMQAWREREAESSSDPARAGRRAGLIASLAEATNSSEIAASFIEAMSLGIAVGMDAMQPAENRIGIARLRERMRVIMPPERLRAEMAASVPVMYGYIYRDVAEADLAEYLKFNRSPLGKRYNQAVNDSLTEAVAHASVRVGELVQSRPARKQI